MHVPGKAATPDAAHAARLSIKSRRNGERRFDIVHQLDRTNHFTAIEAWSDQKSDDGHELASHTRTFRGGITPLLGASTTAAVQAAVEGLAESC